MKAATYLLFKDNAREVIETYQSRLGAEVICEYAFQEGMTQNPALIGKIFHAELKIGDLNLYLCDTGQAVSFDSLKIVVEISDEGAAQAFLDQLAKFGEIVHNFSNMPVGPAVAHAQDKFGIKWDVVTC